MALGGWGLEVFEAGSCSWEPDEGTACVTLSLFDLPPPESLINGQEEAENCHPLHATHSSPWHPPPATPALKRLCWVVGFPKAVSCVPHGTERWWEKGALHTVTLCRMKGYHSSAIQGMVQYGTPRPLYGWSGFSVVPYLLCKCKIPSKLPSQDKIQIAAVGRVGD